jgi:hypothetical protein
MTIELGDLTIVRNPVPPIAIGQGLSSAIGKIDEDADAQATGGHRANALLRNRPDRDVQECEPRRCSEQDLLSHTPNSPLSHTSSHFLK